MGMAHFGIIWVREMSQLVQLLFQSNMRELEIVLSRAQPHLRYQANAVFSAL